MPFPDTILFYVDDIERSQAFYTPLIGAEPVHASSDFVLYAAKDAPKFALWRRGDANPAASVTGGGGEVNITAKSKQEVDDLYAQWSDDGAAFLHKPKDVPKVGYTFVAHDPDGHRIRVFYDPRFS